MKIDLHSHSNYSDGILTPKELVDLAILKQIDIFALTDHDSVFGCDEILKYAKEKNVKVICGMELSTEYKNKSVHIVCLFKHNKVPQELLEFSKNKKEERKQRAIKMMENIKNIYNVKIDLDSLLKNSEVITRANMLYNIAKCNNISESEAAIYVDSKSKAYIPSTKLTTEEGIAFVKKLDVITILAHPCLLPRDYVEEIVKMGVDGIEVYYPQNKNDDEAYFKSLASKYNLLISGGSDFHGDKTNKHAMIGTSTINENEFTKIKERLMIEWK